MMGSLYRRTALGLAPGMVAMRDYSTNVYKIVEITEPMHPAMPGVVVHARIWSHELGHWTERVSKINDLDVTRKSWGTSDRLTATFTP